MGIAVSKDRLRPYTNIPTQETDPESLHTTINVEVSVPNGVSTNGLRKFENKRWGKMFTGIKQHRFAPKGNGK
jgi:hypothetical protein